MQQGFLMVVATVAGMLCATGGELVLLGTNPVSVLAAPNLHTLHAFEGRIYMGYGNWNGAPATVIASYQPADGSMRIEFPVGSDSIGLFREIAGSLYVPSTDPIHFHDFRDFSFRRAGVWRDQTPAGLLHAFDIGTLTGTDLWLVGSKMVNETRTYGPAVYRSVDGGRTWVDRTVQSSQSRYYWGFALNGRFWVSDANYTPEGVGTRVSVTAGYTYLYKPTLMGHSTNQFIVASGSREPGLPLLGRSGLVTFDGANWRAISGNLYDFTVSGSNVFTLEYNPNSAAREIYTASLLSPTGGVWQVLNLTNVPAKATCVEVFNDLIFVGDESGRLWGGRLDGTAFSSPALTVVNEMDDEFGRGLTIDGHRMAVGAPNFSGSNYLCGQVTIWERPTSGEESGRWTLRSVIDPPEPSFSGWFGKDVALKGDLLVVAETGRDITHGDRGVSSLVHVYQHTGAEWTIRMTTNHSFIHSVATDGDLIVVGTSTQLYLYRVSRDPSQVLSVTPETSVTLTPTTSMIYEPAVAVAVENNLIIAALSGDISRFGGPGEVRAYQRLQSGAMVLTDVFTQTWTPPPNGSPYKPDRFGYSISLNNGWLAVGAPRSDVGGRQVGSVYLYKRSGLMEGDLAFIGVLEAPHPQPEAGFGTSVSLSDSRLVIGSPGNEVNGQRGHGSAYVYGRSQSNWYFMGEVPPPSGSNGELGFKVAADNLTVAVASRYSTPSTNLETRIALQPHLEPYQLWSIFHGIEGIDALESSDPDGDGANNLVEYACNLNPLTSDVVVVGPSNPQKGTPLPRLTEIEGEMHLVLTHVQRRDADLLGLFYSIETSADLEQWIATTEPAYVVYPIGVGWDLVTYRFPINGIGQMFCRVRVELRPQRNR